jgi:ADP-ribose pyrophosphatase YjhB (NUDIX family)
MSQKFIYSNIETCLKPDYVQLVIVVVFWQGQALLIHRQSEPFKDLYSIPGGHLEDETYETAARRELEEETGIKADKLLPLQVFIDDEHRIECHGFRFDSPDGQFSNPVGEEQEVIGWRELAEVAKLPLTPGLRELFLAI